MDIDDIKSQLLRIEQKSDVIIDRLSQIETQTVKNETDIVWLKSVAKSVAGLIGALGSGLLAILYDRFFAGKH